MMRVRCSCGRNLADVSLGPDDKNISVLPRSGVEQSAYRETRAGYLTCRWVCRCGRDHRRTYSSIMVALVAGGRRRRVVNVDDLPGRPKMPHPAGPVR